MKKLVRKIKTLISKNLLLPLATKGIALRENERQLNKLTDLYRDKKAVIIGMGPSLKIEDLKCLGDVVTFACNKIFLSFDSTDWRPNIYSICDILVAENNRERILSTDFGKARVIHSVLVQKSLGSQKNALFYRNGGSLRRQFKKGEFKLWPRLGGGILAGGASIIIDQIQMAYAMGFSEVYLIGIDLVLKFRPASRRQRVPPVLFLNQPERSTTSIRIIVSPVKRGRCLNWINRKKPSCIAEKLLRLKGAN